MTTVANNILIFAVFMLAPLIGFMIFSAERKHQKYWFSAAYLGFIFLIILALLGYRKGWIFGLYMWGWIGFAIVYNTRDFWQNIWNKLRQKNEEWRENKEAEKAQKAKKEKLDQRQKQIEKAENLLDDF